MRFIIYGTFMRGQPGHGNLEGARFLEAVRTAPRYRLWFVDGRAPALVPAEDGVEIECELYGLDDALVGRLAGIEPPGWERAPVELTDGRTAEAFLGDPALTARGVDVSTYGGWAAFVASPGQAVEVRIDHVWLPVADLAATRAFYSAALAPLGYRLVYEAETELGFGDGDKEPIGFRQLGRPSVGSHVAFTAAGPGEVEAFHAAAVAAGGVENSGPGSDRTAATTTRPACSTPTATTSRPSSTADGYLELGRPQAARLAAMPNVFEPVW